MSSRERFTRFGGRASSLRRATLRRREGVVRLWEDAGEQVPHVRHVGDDLEGDVDAGVAGAGGEPHRVVAQDLGPR